ncbi:riboflavin synthase [Candidatus Methylacidiphilum fumarolicum]|uniref:Riboflavin synthase n=3 Tax=Candidatus Methylacidiphilum fumarolicum TaxID=591154 RepID=I0K151_METFB|nr:riboflavin synthase [Candidatus Methylacidiphilum fumarolicum]CCG93220.1 Riboflavin synthase alpha chain [Methylacidiphilum fumariolicum SolV]MBW6415987.1 riboflavin synthase [Candidatus Methylacidiphilum fumarolicum]TFE66155.1 riboflavin synthase subunit alpha [Candidatus Methylacidiphilum fumarolicum]TFE71738.1 riboflavin synthase [Candidatus Methylacidiphilum fumarolicum]TFE71960.1 riboflavin synthase [Candidatus Methylacidiphilum fumarolicum]
MFTGIIESRGIVERVPDSKNKTLSIRAGCLAAELKPGISLAVNGCCLTVTQIIAEEVQFFILEETLRATTLGELKMGDEVNLELPLRMSDRFGGHFVTGHVDCKQTICAIEKLGEEKEIWIHYPSFAKSYMVPKGSIAVEGISLTIGKITNESFCVWITPFTLNHTNLRTKRPGDKVNLEFDLLAKYAQKIINERMGSNY